LIAVMTDDLYVLKVKGQTIAMFTQQQNTCSVHTQFIIMKE